MKQRSILLIDPNHQSRRLLADVCRQLGIAPVTQASSAERGLTLLDEALPDAVLCDWSEDCNGLAFVEMVRAHGKQQVARVPLFLLRAGPSKSDVDAARRAAVTAILARPFSARTLRDRLETVWSDDGPWH